MSNQTAQSRYSKSHHTSVHVCCVRVLYCVCVCCVSVYCVFVLCVYCVCVLCVALGLWVCLWPYILLLLSLSIVYVSFSLVSLFLSVCLSACLCYRQWSETQNPRLRVVSDTARGRCASWSGKVPYDGSTLYSTKVSFWFHIEFILTKPWRKGSRTPPARVTPPCSYPWSGFWPWLFVESSKDASFHLSFKVERKEALASIILLCADEFSFLNLSYMDVLGATFYISWLTE